MNPPGGRAHVHADAILQVDFKDLQRPSQLVRAAADIGIQRSAHAQALVGPERFTGAQNLPIARHDAALHNQRPGQLDGFEIHLFKQRFVRAALLHAPAFLSAQRARMLRVTP